MRFKELNYNPNTKFTFDNMLTIFGFKYADGHTRAAPKAMPPIYFHENYNRYKDHNNNT